MWIMDKVFLFTNFGWVSWMHDDFFILAVSQVFHVGYFDINYVHYFSLDLYRVETENKVHVAFFPRGELLM